MIQATILINALMATAIGLAAGQWLMDGKGMSWLVTLIVTGIAASAIGVFAARRINRPLDRLAAALQDMAEGRRALDAPLAEQGDPTVERLCRYTNQLLQDHHRSLTNLAASTNQLAFTAAELFTVTERTETNTRQQQLETDQVATAMNEMNATVEEVARNTSDAAVAAKRVNDAARTSEQVARDAKNGIDSLVQNIGEASRVISQLEAESNNIGVVLEVIKTIADQTNLLALNAAIEAARAGEQGRGFAVVADEVRTLAIRTQSSAREIEEMIGRLQVGVRNAVKVMDSALVTGEEGSGKVNNTLTTLGDILQSVNTISDMNTQIATAAEEQTQVANEINRNLVAIAQLADKTTDDARVSRTTAEQLAAVSQKLQDMVRGLGVCTPKALDLSSAKAAHLNWKTRLRAFLDGKASLSMEQAVSHRHCDFGKWYYGTGLKEFGHLQPLVDVETPHQKLHELIRTIIDLKNSGRAKDAEQAYQNVARLSQEIVARLEETERQAAAAHRH